MKKYRFRTREKVTVYREYFVDAVDADKARILFEFMDTDFGEVMRQEEEIEQVLVDAEEVE